MAKQHSKRYRALAEKIERGREYPPDEAAKLVKDTSQAKFDTTVELHLRMGVDPKHADQMVRGAAVLPNGTGKKVRVIAFAQGEKAREAQAAGADTVGAEDLAKRIEGGWLEFGVDKTGVIHTVVGKSSFSEEAIMANLATLIDAVNRARPAGIKGSYIRAAHLTSTQGPSVKLDLQGMTELAGRAGG